MSDASDVVTISLGANPGGGRLVGYPRAQAVNGIARFPALGVDSAGQGYTFSASAPGLPPILSGSFDVSAPAFLNLASNISGQPVRALAFAGAPPVLYASTEQGVYRSANGGSTWLEANFGNPGHVGTVTSDDSDGTVLYAVPGAGAPSLAPLVGFPFVGKSSDGGETWRHLAPPRFDVGQMSNVVVDPRDPATVYAGGRSGVYRSTDGGETWAKTAFERECHGLVFHAQAPGELLAYGFDQSAANARTLLASTNGGATWTTRTALDNELNGLFAFGAALFAATNVGLSRSVDGGTTWVFDPTPTSLVAGSPTSATRTYAAHGALLRTSNDGGATFGDEVEIGLGVINALLVDPVDASRLYVGTNSGVYVSTDAGLTWNDPSTGMGMQRQETVALHPDAPSTVLVGGRDGTFRSTDSGATWVHTQPDRTIFGLAFHPDDARLAYACDLGGTFYRSTDAGATWDSGVSVGNGPYCYEVAIVGDSLWVPTVGGVQRSTDGGATWQATGLTHPTYTIAAAPDGLTLYAGTNGGTYKSADGGATWLPMVTSDLARAIIIDPSAPNTVYAGMGCGTGALGAVGSGGVKRSVDAGQGWLGAGTLASCIADFEFAGTTLYVLGENVARSRDGGDTWVTGGPGLQGQVQRVAITPDEETLFVAAADGVYRSVAGGF